MTAPAEGRDPLEQLAEEFIERLRRGGNPSPSEYASRHPEMAEQIRRLFPALVLMEQAGGAGGPGGRAPPAGLTRLGEYRIVREVGRGGMGVVFEAVQESLGRRVALKVLPPELCRDKYLERFKREAKAAARLHHTNIVPVFGVGEDGGTHFYVMQFIDGRGLDGVLREVRRLREAPGLPSTEGELSALAHSLLSGRFAATPFHGEAKAASDPATAPPSALNYLGDSYYRTIARLGLQAAEALHHAHTQGVLHRDVKPSNLLLDARGDAWVTDFGLAKADDAEDLTDTGDFVGTLRYVAPERLQGRCDARSDVYGLGVTLFELLALRPAFDASGRLSLMDQIARGAAPGLRQLAPQVPRDLETVVGKAMAREPADRYTSARELADDLDRVLSDRPVQARRSSAAERLARWCRRHPAVAALSSAVVVLLAAGAAGGWWAAARLGQQVEAVTLAERDTRERLWESRLAQARAGRASRLPGQRFRSLEALAEAARIRPSRELRNEAVACLALADVRAEREWDAELETDRLEYSTGVAFDPALEHHACTAADGTVSVRATEGDRLLVRFGGMGGPADYLQFSPDGRYLAARYNVQGLPCRVWDWREKRVVFETPRVGCAVLALDFLPDGTSLVLGGKQRLQVVALPSGRTLQDVKLNFTPTWLAAGPGGLVAACGEAEKQLRLIDLARGKAEVVGVWTALPAELVAVAWHPGGALLAASGRDGALYTFDLGAVRKLISLDEPRRRGGKRAKFEIGSPTGESAVLQGHLLEARELAFSPDGSLLVSRAWDGTTRFWDPAAGRELLRVRGVSFLRFDRAGGRMAYRGYHTRRLGVWELADRSVVRVLHAPDGRASLPHAGVSFSPDSRLLATSADEGVCLWDARTGRLLGQVNTGRTTDVLFDPGGRYLYAAGSRGTMACPLARSVGAAGVSWRVEPPRPSALWPLGRLGGFHLRADRVGERLAVVERFSRVVVFSRPGLRGPRVELRGHPGVSFAAVSPDGRYVATGTWRGRGVQVWEADSGRPVWELPAEQSAGVEFTPDGTRLLVLESEGAYRAHRVGTWECEWARGDPDTGFTRGLRAAFHPSGRVMAHVSDRVNLRLVDLETGDEVAVLPVPESQNLAGYQFSPDGRYVAAVTVRGSVQLWDLRRLRAALREAGLDWDQPEWGGEGGEGGATRLEVAGG